MLFHLDAEIVHHQWRDLGSLPVPEFGLEVNCPCKVTLKKGSFFHATLTLTLTFSPVMGRFGIRF
jgi:hypothetical protein